MPEAAISNAEQAEANGRWAEAAETWRMLFTEAAQPSLWRRAGRRAALAHSKAGDHAEALRTIRSVLERSPSDAMARIALAQIEDRVARQSRPATYWGDREHLLYLVVAREIATRIGANASSIVDVGSFGTPILEWFPNVPVRHSVDLVQPYEAPGVVSTKSDFLLWRAPQHFDVALCFQVLEHVPDAGRFARKLLETCDVLIISVPYKWPAEKADVHVHDPVDERKMRRWFKREPNFTYKIKEIYNEKRMIFVYDNSQNSKWKTIDQRSFKYRWLPRNFQD